MVGPSSSHTAGAVRLRIARRLLGSRRAGAASRCWLLRRNRLRHGGSLIAGLLGFQPDDERIAGSFGWAEKAGLSFSFATSHVGGEHPNTARVELVGRSGKTLSMTGSSLGGGRIMVVEMNGLRANFSGDLPTLIVQNIDQPGHVNEVTGMLTERGINIATMQLYRDHPGGNAVMIIETDKAVPPDGLAWLERCEGITRVTFIDAGAGRINKEIDMAIESLRGACDGGETGISATSSSRATAWIAA